MSDIPPHIPQYSDQSLSAIHHALRASRRRLVIALITHRIISSPEKSVVPKADPAKPSKSALNVSVRQLARELVSIEENVQIQHATGEAYHNVYTSLIQTHLPRLDDVQAIEYDSDRKNIGPGKNLPALAVIAAITSPAAQMLFHNTAADLDI